MLKAFLLSVRIAALLMLTPILYASTLPASYRTILVFSLSLALALGIAPASSFDAGPTEVGAGFIILAAARELALGATLAVGIFISFAAISIAGRVLDIQIGFGMAQVFDPLTRTQLPILTMAFNQLAVVYFFLINGHHTLLRAVAYSIERFPLGKAWSIEAVSVPVLKQVGGLFSLGFALAAPVVFCVLLVELALGVVARNLPQMNMFVMGVPIKIVVGLAALSFGFVMMGSTITRIQGSIFQSWSAVFSVAEAHQVRLMAGGLA
ncbi:flagellar biosynthetic protein FliR [Undibacterium sp. JH2W]|uniref:flagellar biosynthetic protein FliR n=1 Tax=Undibacterium sp. JH2W TaxID=3413037 RepID=UPI003BF36077